MNSKDFLRVVREMRRENGLPWPLPVTLAVPEAEARGLEVGAEVALVSGQSDMSGDLRRARQPPRCLTRFKGRL